jgi:hypothetical protein
MPDELTGISSGYWMADPATGGAILGEMLPLCGSNVLAAGLGAVRVSAFSCPKESNSLIGENNWWRRSRSWMVRSAT